MRFQAVNTVHGLGHVRSFDKPQVEGWGMKIRITLTDGRSWVEEWEKDVQRNLYRFGSLPPNTVLEIPAIERPITDGTQQRTKRRDHNGIPD